MAWTVPKYFDEHFPEVDLDFLREVHDQSQLILKEKIETGDSISKRAYTVLGISGPAFAFAAGTAIESVNGGVLKAAAISESALCLIAMMILVQPIISRTTRPFGTSPKEILRPEFVKGIRDSNYIMKNLILNLIVTNQERISFCESENRIRLRFVDSAIFVLSFSPFISATISYLMLLFFP